MPIHQFSVHLNMQIPPPKYLAPFIRHYILLENSENDLKNVRLFTDGSTGLILSADRKLYSHISEDPMPISFFYGTLSGYRDFYAKGIFSLIAVVFQPYFLNILLKVSAKEIRNQIICAEDILKSKLEPFQESLSTTNDPLSVINSLNVFFTQFLSEEINPDYGFITAVQRYILHNKGSATSKELERFTGYSERHLERKFEIYMGISPKKYSNIIRLHFFLSLMNKGLEDKSLTSLSYHAGYTDQSHLIREFKTNVGLTPKQYVKTENKMAVNFIEL